MNARTVGGRHAGPLPASARPSRAALSTSASIDRARRYARSRHGVVAFAVLDGRGRLRGLRRTVQFPAASVVKAMLLVASLRASRGRRLTGAQRALLEPMVTVSDNDAGRAVFGQVGAAGLRRVARAARMSRFYVAGAVFEARITAADQARLFLRIDHLVPARHRRYARKLLSQVVGSQRWGIPPAAARHRARAFFKGGWRPGLLHQAALVERRGRRIAITVLTAGGPSMAYGERTIEGIANRVLR